jgi:hypothetical protein
MCTEHKHITQFESRYLQHPRYLKPLCEKTINHTKLQAESAIQNKTKSK